MSFIARCDIRSTLLQRLRPALPSVQMVAVGSSSSVIVSVTSDGPVTSVAPTTVPDTVTSLSGASTVLSSALIVTLPVLVSSPSAIASVRFALSVKSPGAAGAIAAADTVTVSADADAESRLAVTVLTPLLSPIEDGDSSSVTTGSPPALTTVVGAAPRGVAVAVAEGRLGSPFVLMARTWKVCATPPVRPLT